MEAKVEELALHLVVVEKALATLEEALAEPFSLLVRDAAIQRFENTFELAWKLFRRLAKTEGIEVGSPRQAIRAAYDVGVLGDVDTWFELLEDRNRTPHTYSAKTAEEVYESARRLPEFLRAAVAEVRKQHVGGGGRQRP